MGVIIIIKRTIVFTTYVDVVSLCVCVCVCVCVLCMCTMHVLCAIVPLHTHTHTHTHILTPKVTHALMHIRDLLAVSCHEDSQ